MPLISIRDRIKLLSDNIDSDNFRVLSHDTILDTQTMPDLATKDGQEAISHLTDWAEFIVLDNLATLCRTGQENTTEAWKTTQTWLLQLRAKGKTILVVDHAGKNGKNRGASAKQDVLDTVICLKHPSDYEDNQGARFVVHIEKNRNANPIESIEAHLVGGNTWNVSNAKQSREEQIIQLLNDGLSQTEIAEEIGCNRSTVYRIKKKYDEQQKYLKNS